MAHPIRRVGKVLTVFGGCCLGVSFMVACVFILKESLNMNLDQYFSGSSVSAGDAILITMGLLLLSGGVSALVWYLGSRRAVREEKHFNNARFEMISLAAGLVFFMLAAGGGLAATMVEKEHRSDVFYNGAQAEVARVYGIEVSRGQVEDMLRRFVSPSSELLVEYGSTLISDGGDVLKVTLIKEGPEYKLIKSETLEELEQKVS